MGKELTEDEAQQSNPSLDITDKNILQAYEELKYLRSLRRATRGITHNYNNIFSGIIGNIESHHPSRANEHETLKQLLHRAINETEILFQFARLADEKKKVQSFGGIIDSAIRALKSVSPKYTIKLRCHEPFMKVKGYTGKLILLLFYLGENSMEAMPGGGRITFETELQYDVSGLPWITVKVSDDGPGIAQELVSRLFTPFVTTKKTGAQLGLGLFFAQRYAELNSGKLDYSANRENGAGFTLMIPAEVPEKTTDAKKHASTNEKKTIKQSPNQVFFVIEDDSILLGYLVEGLQRRGHIVFSAASCAEAFEDFVHVQNIVTVMLVDIGLTDHDGVECIELFRQRYNTPSVIFMSGEKDHHGKEFAKDTKFLRKPFTINELEGIVSNASAS